MVTQEAIHSIRSFEGRKYDMTLKIDLEKAYDRIRWSFLLDTILKVGLPSLLIVIIINCVSLTSLQVL